MPRKPDDDPGALVRAVDELQRVRDVVLPRADEYARQRRQEKLAGQRSVRTSPPPWYSLGWSDIAYCPDPEHHPTAPLDTVVRAILDRYAAGINPDTRCLACGNERCRPGRACPTCGVHPAGRAARWHAVHVTVIHPYTVDKEAGIVTLDVQVRAQRATEMPYEVTLDVPSGKLSIGDADGFDEVTLRPGRWLLQFAVDHPTEARHVEIVMSPL